MKVNPRLGVLATLAAAFSGALVQHYADPDFKSWPLVVWNIVMRFVSIHVVVSLLGRLCRPGCSVAHYQSNGRNSFMTGLAHYWAVIMAGIVLYAGIISLQMHASPHLMFLPLYMIPCLIIALVAGWGWGSIMAILCAVAGPLVQSLGDTDYQPSSVMIWNIAMRFIVLQTAVLLLNFMHLKKRFSFFRSPAVS